MKFENFEGDCKNFFDNANDRENNELLDALGYHLPSSLQRFVDSICSPLSGDYTCDNDPDAGSFSCRPTSRTSRLHDTFTFSQAFIQKINTYIFTTFKQTRF